MSVEEVKERLRERLGGSANDAELDIAASVVHQRYLQLCELRTRLNGSSDRVIEYLQQRQLRFDPQASAVNSIHIQTFIPPSSHTQFNGLCLLPTRIDLLTGGVTVHPEYVGECDISRDPIECVPLEVRTEKQEEKLQLEFSLKKIRIK